MTSPSDRTSPRPRRAAISARPGRATTGRPATARRTGLRGSSWSNHDVDSTRVWAGIDVGGRKKGFHVALVDEASVAGLARVATASSAAELVAEYGARVVGVDSPISP